MGVVYEAVQQSLGRHLALKVLPRQALSGATQVQRFRLEARAAARLHHTNIVPVFGVGECEGVHYYAMRSIKGESLKEVIEHFHGEDSLKYNSGRRSLELRKLMRRFTDICNAIDYAHSRGVIHREIKPANIILGRHGETLVVDWGLAKAIGPADPSIGEQTIANERTSKSWWRRRSQGGEAGSRVEVADARKRSWTTAGFCKQLAVSMSSMVNRGTRSVQDVSAC
jgi:serine/threonine protein kinase